MLYGMRLRRQLGASTLLKVPFYTPAEVSGRYGIGADYPLDSEDANGY